MINRKSILLTIVAVMLAGGYATGQAASSAEPSAKEKALMLQATSADRSARINLLFQIETGAIKADADTTKVLAYLAGDGTVFRTSGSGAGYDNSDIRMRAVTLLGNAGGDDARAAILRALDSETDPNVKGAAFVALGNMGAGSDMLTIRVMNSAMRHDFATSRSSSAASDYIDAVSKLVSASNPDDETFNTAMYIAEGNGYNAQVRQKAYNFLRSLWS
jgi:hypothetical protein